MGKRSGRLKQALALLLAFSCVAGSVPRAAYAKDGADIAENLEAAVEGTETAEAVESVETGTEEAEQSEAGSMETETGSAGAETEKSGTETGEQGMEAAEIAPSGTEESGDDGRETETQKPETETVEPETEETEEAETEEPEIRELVAEAAERGDSDAAGERILPALHDLAATEAGAQPDSGYTDSNGVTYSYYTYDDGTAAIHTITGYEGKDVDIPGEIDGYAVTQIVAALPYGAELHSLTIPEPVAYIGESAFCGADIGVLYYNAVEASTTEDIYMTPFSSAKIGGFYTGGNVRIIPERMFNLAVFTGSVALTAEAVGSQAFLHAGFGELTLTDEVKMLHGNAFGQAEIGTLHYNTHAVHTAGGISESAFHQARISALDIGADVTEMPDYAFSEATFSFDAFTVELERVGDYAFYKTWASYDPYSVKLTVTDRVDYIGACAFAENDIGTLILNADAKTGATDTLTGAFYSAEIGTLAIGENVTQIPDYMFCYAYITQDALDLKVDRIGRCAFYYRTTVTDLTIGEGVEDIGVNAFYSSKVANLHYNAVCATVSGEAEIKTGDGPFSGVTLSGLTIGEHVESIPRCLLSYAGLSAESLHFPDSLKNIGEKAFYSGTPGKITVSELTIGEGTACIGKCAFYGCAIDRLSYLAADAEVPGAAKTGDGPFYTAKPGSLRIGDGVRELPDYVLCGIYLTQEELVIPDGVEKIGRYALSDKTFGSDIRIGTLVVGKNVSHAGAGAFAGCTIDRAVVYAVKADDGFEGLSFTSAELPACASVEIHTDSDFFRYFTKKTSADSITSMCSTFETVYGEEYFDADENSFIAPYRNACVVCGYGSEGENRTVAFTATFLDFNGRVIDSQHVKSGSAAAAPESPQRTGYRFTGWDRAFDSVTENLTIRAQYEALKFTVSFVC